MNDAARQRLTELMTKEPGLYLFPPVCEERLRATLKDMPMELDTLIGALRAYVPRDLSTPSGRSSQLSLVQRLVKDLGWTPETAQWAVASWAMALGLPAMPKEGDYTSPSGGEADPGAGAAAGGAAAGDGKKGKKKGGGAAAAAGGAAKRKLHQLLYMGANGDLSPMRLMVVVTGAGLIGSLIFAAYNYWISRQAPTELYARAITAVDGRPVAYLAWDDPKPPGTEIVVLRTDLNDNIKREIAYLAIADSTSSNTGGRVEIPKNAKRKGQPTGWIDDSVLPGHTYRYAVQAVRRSPFLGKDSKRRDAGEPLELGKEHRAWSSGEIVQRAVASQGWLETVSIPIPPPPAPREVVKDPDDKERMALTWNYGGAEEQVVETSVSRTLVQEDQKRGPTEYFASKEKTSHVDPKLAPGKYEYELRAWNGYAYSEAVKKVYQVRKKTYPQAPAVTGAYKDGIVELTWTPLPGEDVEEYVLYRRMGEEAQPALIENFKPSEARYVDQRASELKTHALFRYHLKAKFREGHVSEGKEEMVEVNPAPAVSTPPTKELAQAAEAAGPTGSGPEAGNGGGAGGALNPPMNVRLERLPRDEKNGGTTLKGLKILWDKVDGASGYRVYRQPNPGAKFEVFKEVSADELEVTDRDVRVLWDYFAYTVVALNAAKEEGEVSEELRLRQQRLPPKPYARESARR